MDKNLLKSLLTRLSRHAFESFVVELFSTKSPFRVLPEAGEGVYYQELLDSYGGSLHTAFLLHYSPLELFNRPNLNSISDPDILQRLRNVRNLYKGQIGYWGMISPFLRKADRLQSLGFVTNLYGIDRNAYEGKLIPQYVNLSRRSGLKKMPVVVGSYDSSIELNPDGAEEAFRKFIVHNSDGISISISSDRASVERFVSERNLTGGVLQNTKYPYEPVFLAHLKQKEVILAEFESLIREDTSESELETFIRAHYKDIFGSRYDRIETQLWLRFPELDIAGRKRRLDVLLRNSVINDWELFEIKRVVKLTRSYRDAPVLSREITHAIQQIKNYGRLLSQDAIRKHFAKEGIEYYEPSLHLVVGKTPQIPHKQWRWLLSSNEHGVKIMTFDDLLSEMRLRLKDRLAMRE